MSEETTERKPFPKKALATYSVPEIIDYLIERIQKERIAKIAEKAKKDYDLLIEKMDEAVAAKLIHDAAVRSVENKLQAMK